MIKALKLESVIELLTKIKKNRLLDSFFRGHSDSDWILNPSIGRVRKQYIYYPLWGDFEEDILEKFKKFSIPFLDNVPKNKYEWLNIAQHYGLPTRILDWTTNPLKALYFSVEDPHYYNKDAALWVFRPQVEFPSLKNFIKIKGNNVNSFFSYHPDNLDNRIIAQESCFTSFPLPKNTQDKIVPLNNIDFYKAEISNLKKFEIKKENKDGILSDLNQLGISHRTLFPDLDGLSRSIRREYGLMW